MTSDQDNLNLSGRAGETESMSPLAVPMPGPEFQELIADLRDWQLNTAKLADALATIWNAVVSPAPPLTAGPGITIADGEVSVKISTDPDNGLTLGTDEGLLVDTTP